MERALNLATSLTPLLQVETPLFEGRRSALRGVLHFEDLNVEKYQSDNHNKELAKV